MDHCSVISSMAGREVLNQMGIEIGKSAVQTWGISQQTLFDDTRGLRWYTLELGLDGLASLVHFDRLRTHCMRLVHRGLPAAIQHCIGGAGALAESEIKC